MKPARTVGRICLLAGVAAAVVVALGGCYRHVVEVKGPGAAHYNVYEPHYKPEEERQIKDWFGNIFGQKSGEPKKR